MNERARALVAASVAATAAEGTAVAATTAATAARALRLGFVDFDLATVERLAVHGLRGRLRLRIRGHLDEAEALALAAVAIGDQADGIDSAARSKCFAQRLFGSG